MMGLRESDCRENSEVGRQVAGGDGRGDRPGMRTGMRMGLVRRARGALVVEVHGSVAPPLVATVAAIGRT
jgi:hypothetical protein